MSSDSQNSISTDHVTARLEKEKENTRSCGFWKVDQIFTCHFYILIIEYFLIILDCQILNVSCHLAIIGRLLFQTLTGKKNWIHNFPLDGNCIENLVGEDSHVHGNLNPMLVQRWVWYHFPNDTKTTKKHLLAFSFLTYLFIICNRDFNDNVSWWIILFLSCKECKTSQHFNLILPCLKNHKYWIIQIPKDYI